jgi:hypothetical protein
MSWKTENRHTNPFQVLLKSRKFLVLPLDIAVSLMLYFSAKYLAAGTVEDIETVILALQPVVLVLISAIAYEDGQAMKAEALVETAKLRKEPASAVTKRPLVEWPRYMFH